MNKKFKRLISVILTVMMAIGMMPFSGLTTVSAAEGYTVYFNTSGNSTAQWGNTVYIYAYNGSNDNSGIVQMETYSGTYLKKTFDKRYKNVVFLDVNSWNQGVFHQTQDLAIPWNYANPCYTLDGGFIQGSGYKTGTWSNYAGGGGTATTTTGTYYAPVDLVDYFNDARVDAGSSSSYSSNNQGDLLGNRGSDSAAFEYFNQALSGNAGTDANKYSKPLYFGSLLFLNNRVGRGYKSGTHNSLARWNSTINVALAEKYEQNGWQVRDNLTASVQGLVSDTLGSNGELRDPITNAELPYFSKNIADNWTVSGGSNKLMAYYEGYQFPFKSEKLAGSTVTKYSYDSASDYAVYLNWSNLNDKKLQQNNEQHIANITQVDGQPQYGFYPLNKPTDSGAAVNYGFGTKFTIPFTVNENGTIDGTKNGEPITFNFTGDDDVWVFLDGKLILDMGGAHAKSTGSINFKNLTATVDNAVTADQYQNQYANGNSNDSSAYSGLNNWFYNNNADERSTLSSSAVTKQFSVYGDDFANSFHDSSKKHTLTMFYMERGMFDSNMKIEFTINPLPSGLTLSKTVDTANVNAGLVDKVKAADDFDFEIQTKDLKTEGSTFAIPANLGYSLNDYHNTVVDDYRAESGVVTGVNANYFAQDFINTQTKAKAFAAGTGFQIKESESKADKYDYSKTKWEVYDATSGSYKLVGGDTGTTATFDMGSSSSTEWDSLTYAVNFTNTPKVGNLTLEKKYTGTAPTGDAFEFTVLVDLDGGENYAAYPLAYTSNKDDGGTTSADGKLSIQAGETVTFAGIPAGATYKITETDPTEGAIWVKDTETGTTGTITAGATASAVVTNKTNSVDVNKVIYVEAGKTGTTYTPSDVTITNTTAQTVQSGAGAVVNGNSLTITAPLPDKKDVYKISGTDSTGANLSDSSTLTVYSYKATDKVYVFDYGLKSDIAKTNTNGDGLFQGGVFYNTEAEKTTNYKTNAALGAVMGNGNTQTAITPDASVSINADGSSTGSVTFEPKAFMDQAENYKYTADITKAGATLDASNPETGTVVNGTIKVMPASVVYYEDNFNAGATGDSSVKIVYGNYCTPEGTAVELKQSNDQTEQYGHDDAYANGVGDSAGGSTAMRADATATFTFKGTGFDIIARTTTETAGIVYQIQDESGKPVKIGAVDTFYANGDLYQIPVIHEEGLTYGKYTVTLGIKANVTGEKVFVYLDGIRVYNPMGVSGDTAYIDNEEGATVSKVSSLILGNGQVTETGVVDSEGKTIKNATIPDSKAALLGFDETDGLSALGYTVTEDITTPGENDAGSSSETQSILQVLHSGPNNEVYLSDGSAVGFVATAGASTDKTLQIEAKLVNTASSTDPTNGSAALRYLNDSKTATDAAVVSTATAMYYKIPVEDCISLGSDQYLVVLLGNTTEDGMQVLSFSNVKVSGYTLSNPYDNTVAKNNIDTSAIDTESPFVSFEAYSSASIRKKTWTTYKVTVTDACKAKLGDKPFTLYYTNGDTKAKITVTATENGTNIYNLRFKTPNAVGKFPLELHYVDQSGNESSEYISTTLNVKK